MTKQDPKVAEPLDGLDQSKRETLTRLIAGSVYVAPVVAAFPMQGISLRPAHAVPAMSSNTSVPSDLRLKKNVARIGTHPSGCGIYRFNYLWSDTTWIGAIAQDVLEHAPAAVTVGPGNFLAVDYGALGMTMTCEDTRTS
jgi:hypothetical protein